MCCDVYQTAGPKKPKMGCAPGYTKTTSGTCYKKFKQSLNWYEALAFCQQSQGGHLPEPRNSQDNDILYRWIFFMYLSFIYTWDMVCIHAVVNLNVWLSWKFLFFLFVQTV